MIRLFTLNDYEEIYKLWQSTFHTCVDELHRRKSISGQLVEHIIEAMNTEKITKLSLVCFAANDVTNNFWSSLGWTK